MFYAEWYSFPRNEERGTLFFRILPQTQLTGQVKTPKTSQQTNTSYSGDSVVDLVLVIGNYTKIIIQTYLEQKSYHGSEVNTLNPIITLIKSAGQNVIQCNLIMLAIQASYEAHKDN